MKRRHTPIWTILAIVFSLALLAGAAILLFLTIPQKAGQEVSSLETSSVFEVEQETVEPEREAEFEGEIPDAATAPEEAQPEEPVASEIEETVDTSSPAAQTLAGMTEDEKIWQLFYVTPELLTGVETATRAGDSTKQALEQMPVGGIIYFAKNLEDRAQAIEMLQNTQSYAKIPLFLGTDEEGGTVSRVGSNENLGAPTVGNMRALGDAQDPAAVYEAGQTISSALSGLGFNMDFAPVADVASSSSSVIGNRSFGTDASLCASLVSVMTESFHASGMVSCLKHFPGYGSAIVDDHYGTSVLTRTLEELEACDFLPFASGIEAGAPFVMVSHLSVPEVTGDETPCDLSYSIVTEILRNKLDFDGVIITDSHQMASITDHYTSGEAAVKALQAGCDMVLMPQDLTQAFDAVKAALQDGTLTISRIDESVLRILQVKLAYGILK